MGNKANWPRTEITSGFEAQPYHVESFPGYLPEGLHCVCNVNGFNCLSFPDKPGAKFTTSPEFAAEIANRWNAEV